MVRRAGDFGPAVFRADGERSGELPPSGWEGLLYGESVARFKLQCLICACLLVYKHLCLLCVDGWVIVQLDVQEEQIKYCITSYSVREIRFVSVALKCSEIH